MEATKLLAPQITLPFLRFDFEPPRPLSVRVYQAPTTAQSSRPALPAADLTPSAHEAEGSHDEANGIGPLHVVSAWAREDGVALGQVATEQKSNEITAIPQLVKQIELKNTVVTIDAMGCQK